MLSPQKDKICDVMEVVIMVVIIFNMYHINTLYILHLHNTTCQLYLNQAETKWRKSEKINFFLKAAHGVLVFQGWIELLTLYSKIESDKVACSPLY